MTIANVEMAKAWDGDEGDHWTAFADRYDASGARTWRRFLDAGLIGPTDRVLDIGCGAGQSTLDLAALAGQGSAVGVDLSARMLGLARQRAAARGATNVEFLQGDAQVHAFEPAAFDVAASRFGALFFTDRAAAFANIAAALRPGGRLALLGWQALARNEWLNVFRTALAAGRTLPVPPPGSPGPFGLADPDAVRAALTGAGFVDVAFAEINEAIFFGADADDAWSFVEHMGVVKGLTETLDEPARSEALGALQQALADHQTSDGVQMGAAVHLITARRA